MKKLIIISVAALSALFSCTKFENDTADSPLAVPSIDVTIDSKSDSTFTFTVKPGTGTGYYSYTVLKGAAKYLDSTKVLGVSCKGITEATQTMEAKPTVTVTLGVKDGILPNTTYTVYAVAANVQSLVSSVKSATVLTSDMNIPTPTAAAKSATAAAAKITFNESVVRGEGKVLAHYYKVWAPEKEVMTLELAKKDIVISGTDVTLSAPDTVNGAYVLFTWEEGMVKNAVGTPCEEFELNHFYAEKGKIVADSCQGLVTRWPVGTFGWTRVCKDKEGKVVTCPEDSVLAFGNPADAAYLIKADSTIVYSSSDLSVSVAYINSNSATVYKETEKVKLDKVNNVVSLGTKKGSDPEYGDFVVWGVPAGLFIDVWGNTCEAYTNADNCLRSYGYTAEDFCGTYSFILGSDNAGVYYKDTVVITKQDADTVIISGLGENNPGWGTAKLTPKSCKAVIDGVFATMTIPADAQIGVLEGVSTSGPYKYDIGLSGGDWGANTTPVVFTMAVKGTFTYTCTETYFYCNCISDGEVLGFWDVLSPKTFTLLTPSPSAVPASVPDFIVNFKTSFTKISQ